MDRREFVKTLGVGGLMVGLGAIAGFGCAREAEEEVVPIDPDPPAPEESPAEAGDEAPTDEAGAEEAGGEGAVEQAVVECPNCGAENQVEEWGVEMTCWRCGHKWTPERPA
ncbi:MAG: twin-arginine translocation signal domain-containing protein [Armatimonadota bacterium]|jgi:hypothetical protein